MCTYICIRARGCQASYFTESVQFTSTIEFNSAIQFESRTVCDTRMRRAQRRVVIFISPKSELKRRSELNINPKP